MTIPRSLACLAFDGECNSRHNDQWKALIRVRALDPAVISILWQAAYRLLPEGIDNHPLGCRRRCASDLVCFCGLLIRSVAGSSWATVEALMEYTVRHPQPVRSRRRPCPTSGVEAGTAIDHLTELATRGARCQGHHLRHALRGTHHQRLMQELGWLSQSWLRRCSKPAEHATSPDQVSAQAAEPLGSLPARPAPYEDLGFLPGLRPFPCLSRGLTGVARLRSEGQRRQRSRELGADRRRRERRAPGSPITRRSDTRWPPAGAAHRPTNSIREPVAHRAGRRNEPHLDRRPCLCRRRNPRATCRGCGRGQLRPHDGAHGRSDR